MPDNIKPVLVSIYAAAFVAALVLIIDLQIKRDILERANEIYLWREDVLNAHRMAGMDVSGSVPRGTRVDNVTDMGEEAYTNVDSLAPGQGKQRRFGRRKSHAGTEAHNG